MKKNCVICGAEFEDTSKIKNRLYCSDICKNKRNYQVERKTLKWQIRRSLYKDRANLLELLRRRKEGVSERGSPEHRQKMIEINKQNKELRSAIMKEKWKEIEFRNKCSEEISKGKISKTGAISRNIAHKLAFKYYEPKCVNCGSVDNLVVHHLDKNFRNNKMDNLTILCRVCHSSIHDIKNHPRKEWDKTKGNRGTD
jgi:5-methylcytosine-specific restriction endonuclease McrA